jgi:hypothetical protein
MHALLFAPRIYGHDSRIDNDDYANDEVMLFKDGTCDESNEIESLAFASIKLHNDNQ